MFKKFSKQIAWISAAALFAVGLFARLNLINKSSFWYDEAFSGMMIKENVGAILQQIIKDKVHPPVYYYLLKLWATIFGNTDTSLRMLSVIFGMGIVIAAFVLIKKLFGTKAALISTALFSLSPYFINYSLEARSYTMLGFEVIFALYLFLVIYKKNFKNIKELWAIKQTKWLAGIFVLMILTHYIGAALIGIMCVLFLFKIYPKYEKHFYALLFVILGIIVARGLLNGGDFRIYPKILTVTSWLPDGNLLSIGEMLYSFLFGVQSQQLAKQEVYQIGFIKNIDAVFIVIIVLSIVVSINILKNKADKLHVITKLFLLSCLATTIVCLFGINIFIPRYLMFLSIIFIVWMSAYISRFNYKAILLASVAYIFLYTQIIWVNNNPYFGDLLPELREEIKTKRVVTQNSWDFLVLKYYLGDLSRNLFFYEPTGQQKKDPWLFFDKSQFTEKTGPEDIII